MLQVTSPGCPYPSLWEKLLWLEEVGEFRDGGVFGQEVDRAQNEGELGQVTVNA